MSHYQYQKRAERSLFYAVTNACAAIVFMGLAIISIISQLPGWAIGCMVTAVFFGFCCRIKMNDFALNQMRADLTHPDHNEHL